MATEILVNDGGAPARILPFTASQTLSGGSAVKMDADGDLSLPGAAAINTIGIMFVDATAGQNCSVITGKGVVVNAYVSGTAAKGARLEVVGALGELGTGSTTSDAAVAIMLGPATSTPATLRKVLLI